MSSLKVFRRAESGQVTRWNPLELAVESSAAPVETQREQIREIFGAGNRPQARPQAAIHAAEAGEGFSAWLPSDLESGLAQSGIPEWRFVETGEPAGVVSLFEAAEMPLETEARPQAEDEIAALFAQARQQAEEIILAAQAEADDILLQAQDEIEAQKKAAYEAGHQQGCREVESALQASRQMVEAVQNWKTDLLAQGESLLVEMLKEMAEKMFGEGVELDTNALQINLNRVMENARGLGNLNIFLNPRDAKLLDPSWSEYQMLVSGDRVRIIPSGKITRGGCFVKGEMGIVDGRVETQLEALLKTFDEASELSE